MRRPLYGWLTAQALSITGTRVSMIAIPLYVLEQTGSATMHSSWRGAPRD